METSRALTACSPVLNTGTDVNVKEVQREQTYYCHCIKLLQYWFQATQIYYLIVLHIRNPKYPSAVRFRGVGRLAFLLEAQRHSLLLCFVCFLEVACIPWFVAFLSALCCLTCCFCYFMSSDSGLPFMVDLL